MSNKVHARKKPGWMTIRAERRGPEKPEEKWTTTVRDGISGVRWQYRYCPLLNIYILYCKRRAGRLSISASG